tara:strand:- start:161 stop:1999 length:1839 start_codon:yes stop_codon:yes gene_type:complete
LAKNSPSGFKTYLQILQYLKRHAVLLIVSIVGYAVYGATQSAFASIMKLLIEALEESAGKGYIQIPLLILAIFIGRGIGSFLGDYYIALLRHKIRFELISEIFDKVLGFTESFYTKTHSADVLTKLNYHVVEFTTTATRSLKIILREGATIIGLIGYLLYLNWKLSLLLLVVLPVIGILTNYVAKRFRKLSHRIQDSATDVTQCVSETIQGHETVKLFQGQHMEKQRLLEAASYNFKQNVKLALTEALSIPVIQFFVAFSLAGLVFVVLSPTMGVQMSAGEAAAFLTAAGLLPKPLRQIVTVNSMIQKGIAAAQSIFELKEQPAEQNTGTQKPCIQGNIVFDQVSFGYGNDELAIDNLSLIIPKGKVTALVGPSGSGKSTLVKLIPRFYSPSYGDIQIDNISTRDIELGHLRSHIAFVSQHVMLFSGTIRDNIAYGQLNDQPLSAVIEAAKAANIHDYITELPDGYDTIVTEQGQGFSGGQRQRIAIARALLKDAPILILDEATSALDNESERAVQSALKHIMQGRTTLVIAHRLSTIENADQIIVMDRGQIAEVGTHQTLLAANGMYNQLHKGNQLHQDNQLAHDTQAHQHAPIEQEHDKAARQNDEQPGS